MITIAISNPDDYRRKTEDYFRKILTTVADKVLGKLAANTVTSITSGIDRQRSIDGGILKQNAPSTIAKKQGADRIVGVPVKIGKGAKAAFGGSRTVRSLVDRGVLRRPSTYEVKKVGPAKYEISVRSVKSADPDDKTSRDLVAGYVMEKGYNFFGIPNVVVKNVKTIVENELRTILPSRL